jgi:hypothetical protein
VSKPIYTQEQLDEAVDLAYQHGLRTGGAIAGDVAGDLLARILGHQSAARDDVAGGSEEPGSGPVEEHSHTIAYDTGTCVCGYSPFLGRGGTEAGSGEGDDSPSFPVNPTAQYVIDHQYEYAARFEKHEPCD